MERRGGFFYALGPHNARSQKDAREQADRSSCSQNKGGIEPDNLLCSRNARPQKALVGRAQWKINQAPSLKKEQASLGGACISLDARSEEQSACSLWGSWGIRRPLLGIMARLGKPIAKQSVARRLKNICQ